MAEKGKQSQRDTTLVNILERMADQLQKQDQLLDLMGTKQQELSQALKASELRMSAQQNDLKLSVEKMQDSISRYRSDMLSLVNEQDHINKKMLELNNLVNRTAYSFEAANKELGGLNERAKTQEKTIGDHYSHSLKQAEILPEKIADSNRSISKLHMDTEKSLGKMHIETQRQLQKQQQEITRRLMVLNDIESALQTLLVRTEPPEKKPFWFIRLFRFTVNFFSAGISRFLRWIRDESDG